MASTHSTTSSTLRRAAAAGALATAALGALGGVAAAADPGQGQGQGQGNPPGNNGTIKVDGTEFPQAPDDHPNNEPHVDCAFAIDFYGYEALVDARLVFEAQQPTGDGVLLDITRTLDDDDATGGGSEEGHDLHVDVDLTDALATYEPHPEQGYHVKLTVHVDGSQGADVKHKVYWVSGCEPDTPDSPGTPDTPVTPQSPSPSTPAPAVPEVPAPTIGVLSASVANDPPVEVLGTTEARALPRTGASTGLLALVGGLLTFGGIATLRTARVLHRRMA
jgi:hypothetical protein